MKSGNLLVGVLAGFAAGATLGVLFAPHKGSSTRRKISEKKDDYAEEMVDKYNNFIEGVTKKFEALKEEVSSNGRL